MWGRGKGELKEKIFALCKSSLEHFGKSSYKMRTQEHTANKGLSLPFQAMENANFYICNSVFQHFY